MIYLSIAYGYGVPVSENSNKVFTFRYEEREKVRHLDLLKRKNTENSVYLWQVIPTVLFVRVTPAFLTCGTYNIRASG